MDSQSAENIHTLKPGQNPSEDPLQPPEPGRPGSVLFVSEPLSANRTPLPSEAYDVTEQSSQGCGARRDFFLNDLKLKTVRDRCHELLS